MNDKYTRELQSSVKNSQEQLVTLENSLSASEAAAKVSLYLAHGNVDRNKLNQWQVNELATQAKDLKNSAASAVNLAATTVAAANNSLNESKKAISNVATAASNMQLSANAITQLASETAGVLAVASSINYDSDIYEAVKKANETTIMAAKCAEKVSLSSLESTIQASQSAAEDVVKDAEATLKTLTEFESGAQTDYAGEAEKAVEASTQTTEAIRAQNLALEQYNIQGSRDEAVRDTRRRLNQVSNHDLKVVDPALQQITDLNKELNPGYSFEVSFRRFINQETIKEYRLMIVPADESPAFDLATAKSVSVNAGDKALKYIPITPLEYSIESEGDCKLIPPLECEKGQGIANCEQIVEHTDGSSAIYVSHYQASVIYSKIAGEKTEEWQYKNKTLHDFSGRPIEHGKAYVAFIYVVYNEIYQNRSNNTMGYLSMASTSLTPKFRLKKVSINQSGLIKSPNNSALLSVEFEADEISKKNPAEYRVVFVYDRNVKKTGEGARNAKDLTRQQEERKSQNETLDKAINGLKELGECLAEKQQKGAESTFRQKRNDLIKSDCLIRGFLLRPVFGQLLTNWDDNEVRKSCNKLISKRKAALESRKSQLAFNGKDGAVVTPIESLNLNPEDLMALINKAESLYTGYTILKDWKDEEDNTSDQTKALDAFLKVHPDYINLLANGRQAGESRILRDIRELLTPISDAVKGGKERGLSELVFDGLLLVLYACFGEGQDEKKLIERVEELIKIKLTILEEKLQNKLPAYILNLLSLTWKEARKHISVSIAHDESNEGTKYENTPVFPFDQETMSLLSSNDYLVATTEKSVTEDHYKQQLDKALSVMQKDLLDNKQLREKVDWLKKHAGEDNPERLNIWVKKTFGSWENLLNQQLRTDQLSRVQLLILHYLLQGQTHEKQGNSGSKFSVGPTMFPTNNYGSPLVENQITVLVKNKINQGLALHLSESLLKPGTPFEKTPEFTAQLRADLESEAPVSYRVLIISAFKGAEKERAKYLEDHSGYSEVMVTLYMHPDNNNNL